MVGFSTGAALAVEYSLARLEGEALPAADALVLSVAGHRCRSMAWLRRLAGTSLVDPRLGKLAWLDLLPEYDPTNTTHFP